MVWESSSGVAFLVLSIEHYFAVPYTRPFQPLKGWGLKWGGEQC
jgi:hypothetical protein